jgi:VWFA-related protein
MPAMLRRRLAALTLVACSWSAGAQQRPPFSSGTDLIVVPTVVLDKKGASVTGLAQKDFQLFEDGKPIPIETFVAPTPGESVDAAAGRFLVLVLDNLTTPPEIAFRVKDIARKFADRMRPSDTVGVIPLNGGRGDTTSGRAAVRAAIDRFSPMIGESIRTPAQDAAHGLSTISSLTQQMAKVAHPRKVLVFIGSPMMFSPQEASAFSDRGNDLSAAWHEAIRDTGRNNVSVYAIDPRGHSGAVGDWSRSFAAETGGEAWVNTNNFNGAVDRIWQETASYYLLGYTPPINDHKVHKIEVKVSTPGATVRARRARG